MNINLNEIIEKEYPISRVPFDYVISELEQRGYKLDDQNREVTTTVVQYFLRHREFLQSEIVKSDNAFHKGLLLFGDYGIGKTMLFETLYKIGKQLILDRGISDLWFSKISAGSFVDEYMVEVKKKNEERRLWVENYHKGRLYIDDLGFEKMAFNQVELFGEILFEREKNRVATFVTTNLSPSEITERYGMRIGDRLPAMFNIIKWNGKSYRK